MKAVLAVLAVLFVVALAVVIGQRLSTEAMAVTVGVVCGVAASIPVSLGLLMALGTGRLPGLRPAGPAEPVHRPVLPAVVVVTPGATQPTWPGLNQGAWNPWPMRQPLDQDRSFRIIGEDEGRLLPD
ncbi:MAG: hypothetical protein KKA73_09455 [Chloroflexi bacterium]|nr:hypothetical protein [Chloroflexota bacterium]MBU1747903.1 hypothetical protein [Chloroflexota bacterium]